MVSQADIDALRAAILRQGRSLRMIGRKGRTYVDHIETRVLTPSSPEPNTLCGQHVKQYALALVDLQPCRNCARVYRKYRT